MENVFVLFVSIIYETQAGLLNMQKNANDEENMNGVGGLS